jgi:dihydrolipoamide dehydrogenase
MERTVEAAIIGAGTAGLNAMTQIRKETARFEGGRKKIMLRAHGMIRIYADRKSGKLLGTEMAAHGGEHPAHLLAWSFSKS